MKKTFIDFKIRQEQAMSFRFECFEKVAEFNNNYPEYQSGIDYYDVKFAALDELKEVFEKKDWAAERFIKAFNIGDFASCIIHWDFDSK